MTPAESYELSGLGDGVLACYGIKYQYHLVGRRRSRTGSRPS